LPLESTVIVSVADGPTNTSVDVPAPVTVPDVAASILLIFAAWVANALAVANPL
jgi:hypothetical protein